MEEANNKDVRVGFINRTIDKIFIMKRERLYLIMILLLAFILRLVAAINLGVSADEMHFVTHAINFYSADRLVTYDQSSGLWFGFTDIMYKVFGFTNLASRLAALIFGSFSILLIYLLTKEFFDDKIALISAFLLAVAPFHVKLTIAEHDLMAMFFVLFGALIFVKSVKNDKIYLYCISGLFVGLAIYPKVYTLLFIPSLLLYFAYFCRKESKPIVTKRNAKKIFTFLIIIFIFTIPALTHNYLLYQDRGFMDLQFTRTFGLGKNISSQYYGWDVQFNAKNSWKGLFFGDEKHIASGTPLLLGAINFIRVGDPINFYLGLLGILLLIIYRKKYELNYAWFFLFSIIFALPFLASIILLPKHFVFLEIFLIPAAAIAVNESRKKLRDLSGNDLTKLIIIIILITSLTLLGLPKMNTNTHFYGKSGIAQAMEFKDDNIAKNALVVADSRIYRGQIHWMLQGKSYLEGSDFIQIINQQDNLTGDYVTTEVYYIECVQDDCGWGGIQNQPEFNASMEALTGFFKNEGHLVKSIDEPDRFKPYYPFWQKNRINTFNIYSAKIPLKSSVWTIAAQPKEWFLYTIGYKPIEKQFDYYNMNGVVDDLLNKLAHWIVVLAVIFAFLSPIFVFYLILKK